MTYKMNEYDPNANVVYFTRLHWVIFLWPAITLCGSFVLEALIPQIRMIALGVALFSMIWIVMTWVTYYFSSLTIKTNQVIIRTGVLVRETIDIPLSKIEAVDIRQSILGSILRYGMVCITGTGGTRRVINYLSNPLTCRRYIEQLLTEAHNKGQ